MPRSATGTWTENSHRSARGFSLLELLIVVAIIGIFVGAAVLSIGVAGRDREMEREILRLRSLLELVREEALIQSRDFGLHLSATGYRFYLYDYQQAAWLEPADDRLLRPRALPDQIGMTLELEGRNVVLPQNLDTRMLESPRPQVAILSSGEVTPFTLAMQRAFSEGRMVLIAGIDGTIETSEHDYRGP